MLVELQVDHVMLMPSLSEPGEVKLELSAVDGVKQQAVADMLVEHEGFYVQESSSLQELNRIEHVAEEGKELLQRLPREQDRVIPDRCAQLAEELDLPLTLNSRYFTRKFNGNVIF